MVLLRHVPDAKLTLDELLIALGGSKAQGRAASNLIAEVNGWASQQGEPKPTVDPELGYTSLPVKDPGLRMRIMTL